jgi:hypothetical protein
MADKAEISDKPSESKSTALRNWLIVLAALIPALIGLYVFLHPPLPATVKKAKLMVQSLKFVQNLEPSDRVEPNDINNYVYADAQVQNYGDGTAEHVTLKYSIEYRVQDDLSPAKPSLETAVLTIPPGVTGSARLRSLNKIKNIDLAPPHFMVFAYGVISYKDGTAQRQSDPWCFYSPIPRHGESVDGRAFEVCAGVKPIAP